MSCARYLESSYPSIKIDAVKKNAKLGNNVIIYCWEKDKGIYFHLKYTGLSQIETKGDFRSVIPVPFFEHEREFSPCSDAYA